MNYKGKLYGRIGNDTYFDTAYTTDDWDAMETKIKEMEKVKRKPLSDGTLPMTESELIEFFSLTGRINDGKYPIYFFKNVYIEDYYYIYADMSRRGENYEKDSGHILITNVKAILWLAERFELIKED